SLLPPQPSSTLFPYTTLFRSGIESNIKAAEIWFLDGKLESPQLPGTEKQGSPLTNAFRIIAASGAKTLNYVGSTYDLGNGRPGADRKSTRLNSSHVAISYAVF